MRLSALLLLVAPRLLGAAPGEIYHWTDSEGNSHFGDHPPAQVSPERLEHLEPDPNAPATPQASPLRFHYEPPKRRTSTSTGKSKRLLRQQRCSEFTQKLDELRERMSRGYTLKQSAALRKRERAYKDGMFENCR